MIWGFPAILSSLLLLCPNPRAHCRTTWRQGSSGGSGEVEGAHLFFLHGNLSHVWRPELGHGDIFKPNQVCKFVSDNRWDILFMKKVLFCSWKQWVRFKNLCKFLSRTREELNLFFKLILLKYCCLTICISFLLYGKRRRTRILNTKRMVRNKNKIVSRLYSKYYVSWT